MRALGAMSGKTAFLDDQVRRQGADVQVIDYKHPRPTSLSYSTIAAFRGETCPSQFEEKLTPPARARHLSGVSVDLLIALGHKDHGKQQCAYSARCDFASFGGA